MTHGPSGLRRGAAIALTVCLTVGLGGTAIAADAADHSGSDSKSFVVSVDGAVPTAKQLSRTVKSMHVTSVRALGKGLAAVEVSGDGTLKQQAKALERSPLVDGASADRRFTIAGASTVIGAVAPISAPDPWYSQQWDLWDSASTVRAGCLGVYAPRAWTKTQGDPGVVVAVLDTGMTPHPDFKGASIVAGYDFVSQTDGIDTGDGNGWDADPSDPGDACSELGQDSSWHGTFVTGEIIAQRGTTGVVGQAPGVSVEPVRVLGSCGGSEADTIAAIEWSSGGSVAGVPANAHPAQVISMSLGSETGTCSDELQAAIDDAIDRGSVVVAAAGNDGSSMNDTSPANCVGVVSVVATTRTGALAGYSNRGDASITPSIAAPGGSDANPIIGDTWTSAGAFNAAGNKGAIAAEQGTSMATPRVSAAIALLLSVHRGLGVADVMQQIAATATPFPADSTCTEAKCGEGIVNAGELVGAKKVFLHATTAKLSGAARVGGRLTALAGSWSPTPATTTYRWLRDGKPIASGTKRTYVPRATDAGHRISVRVQVMRERTLAGVATSPARRISG